MRNTLLNLKIRRSALIFICAAAIGLASYALESRAAQDDAVSYLTKEKEQERHRKAKEEVALQKRNFKIDQILEKARKERAVNNFKRARGYANSALKLDKDNREALAFLEHLDEEERYYHQDQERLKKKKEEGKLAEKEAKRLAKEKKKATKLAKEDDRRKEKERAEAESRAKKISVQLKKAETYLESNNFTKAREHVAKALNIEKDNPEALAMLRRVSKAETAYKREPEKEEPVEKKVEVEEKVEVEGEAPPAKKTPTARPAKKKPAPGEEDMLKYMKPGQPIIVDGDQVEYFEEEGKIVAEGNVSITYGDVVLTCDRIEVSTKDRQALCEGNVRIVQADGTLTGDRILYDFNKEKGEIIGGEVEAFPWFGSAEETSKVGPNEYLLKKGFITTCDLAQPHYRISGREIRIFPDDKVIAKNVVFYIGKVPVLWLPYYYHPIIQTRAKVQFIPGVNTDWGYFILSAWRFYIKGDSKVDVLVDYREKKGFAAGADFYYSGEDYGLPGLGEGIFRAYFLDEYGFATYDPTSFRGEDTDQNWRNRLQWKHRIDFDPKTTGILEFNKMSDEFVLKDYFYNEYEENASTVPNYLSIINSQSNYTASVWANKRFNDFYTVTQRLPEIKLDIPDQRLWDFPLYYSSIDSAVYFDKRYVDESSRPEKVARLDTFHKLSYVLGLGPLNLTPYGTFRGTAYDRGTADSKGRFRAAFGAGLDVFMRYHKVFNYSTNALGLDINGIRHIIVPKAMYYYRHEPSVDNNKLYQMDEIDALDKENKITFSLENKLQTKRGSGKEKRSVDLVRTRVSIDYLFRMKKNNYQMAEDEFQDLKFDLEIRPYDWFYIDSRLEITPSNQAMKTASIETVLTPSDSFSLDLGYRYEKQLGEPRNQLTFDMKYIISPKWQVGLYERFDIEGRTIEEQQISLIRDLHCWEVEFTYDVDGPNFFKDKFSVWLAFRIKAFPDLYLGLSRSFQKRAPGASPVK